MICGQCVEFLCGFVSSWSRPLLRSEARKPFSGVYREFREENCKRLWVLFCPPTVSCLCRSALSPKCVLASCSLRREVMHALPVGNRRGGVVVGSCFNSGQGWEKPASFLLLPRVSKVSLTPNVLSTLCLLHIC